MQALQQSRLPNVDIYSQSEFVGIIDYVRFHNSQNSYTVLSLVIPGQKDNCGDKLYATAVGGMASPRVGAECLFRGKWVDDKKWGKQFKFSNYEINLPSDAQGIVSYLSSICFGVGRVKAKKIVEAIQREFPERNVIEVIQENPIILNKIQALQKVLNLEQAEQIANNLLQNTILAELSSMICGEGISPGLAARIYAEYGHEAVKKVKENPYMLADDVYGVGFKRSDAIGLRIGVDKHGQYRLMAAIMHILKEAQGNGHCYLEPKHIIYGLRDGKASVIMGLEELLGFLPDIPATKAANEKLIEEKKCVRDRDFVYEAALYEAETGISRHVSRIATQKVENITNIDELIEDVERAIGKQEPFFKNYAPEQRQSVRMALTKGLSVISGGPGTGKTTQLNGIIKIYQQLYPYRPVYLCAPTGRAAKRMTETTGLEAKTIHRLLRYNPELGGFMVNQRNPLSGPGLLAVDEASMMDCQLAYDLLQSIGEGIQVVLLGDIDQLPSVGPGSVLRDIILSEVIPTVLLKYNYRQADGSGIANYAHMICGGTWQPPQSGDIEVVLINKGVSPAEGSHQAAQETVKRIVQAKKDGLGMFDWQVLSPQRKGEAGVINLNKLLQDAVNPKSLNKPELVFGKTAYRLGDKVMVTVNNYDLGVFNGDLGLVTSVVGRGFRGEDHAGNEIKGPGLFVELDGEEVFFDMETMGILNLAYATTIHKSQGNEFKMVVMVCVRSHYIMLARNLLYTGITRAKDKLILIAQDSALKRAVEHNKIADRFSRLKERLQEQDVSSY